MTLLQIASDQSSPSSLLTITLSIIGSGALSTLISLFVSQTMKKVDYKFDYKKHILSKRQKAYDDIEKLLIRLGSKKINTDTNKPFHTIFTETLHEEDPIRDFCTYLVNVLNEHNFWVTIEIHDKCIDLLKFLSEYHLVKNGQNMIKLSQLRDWGTANFDQIEVHRITICSQFFSDIKELENIDKFKKSKIGF